MLLKLKHIILLSIISFPVFAQVETETSPPDYIKSIILKGNTQESQLPIIKLGESITLGFDALNGDEADFYYKIEHFDYDWTPSDLAKTEYMQGFDNQRIVNYENSFNTYQMYSHYELRVPNNQTRRLIKTGNYMIKIFDEDDTMVFSRKFMLYSESAAVGVTIKRSRDVSLVSEKQSVDIKILPRAGNLNNPKQTIKTLIIQNNNLNTAITNLKPQYILGNELIYRYTTESSFWGGNEFMFFETKDPRVSNVSTSHIDLKELYHNYLFADIIRKDRPYTYNPDINGNFAITAIDREDVAIEADYIWVHFSLEHPELFENKSIHLYGNFNNYSIDDTTRLTFNDKLGLYQHALKLKQGFYNYKYVVVDENGELDEGAISGNFDITENNYKVLVYYRDLGARYDKIIGLGEATSVNISN